MYSSNAQLLVLPPHPPVVTVEPRDTTVQEGQRVQFTVTATGTTPILYHWQRNGVNIVGANDPTYTIPSCVRADSGATFRCWLANVDGRDTTYAARLSVLPASPVVTQEPSNQTVLVGDTATFSVVATSSVPLTYQWQKNGVPIFGATGATYNTPATIAADSGASYRCLVSNWGGSDTSQFAILSVSTPAVTNVAISPASGSTTTGEHYAVNIVVNNVRHLHAVHVVVGFDSAIVRADSVKQGSFLGGSTTFSYSPDPLSGGANAVTVDHAIDGPNGANGSGTLFTLHFTSLKAGSSNLVLQTLELRDTADQLITSSNSGGTVTVTGLRLNPTVFLEGPFDSTTRSHAQDSENQRGVKCEVPFAGHTYHGGGQRECRDPGQRFRIGVNNQTVRAGMVDDQWQPARLYGYHTDWGGF